MHPLQKKGKKKTKENNWMKEKKTKEETHNGRDKKSLQS
jgi:hypothetical protein